MMGIFFWWIGNMRYMLLQIRSLIAGTFNWVKKCSCLFVEIRLTHSTEIDFLKWKLSVLWQKIESQTKSYSPCSKSILFCANKRLLFHQCQPYCGNSLHRPLVKFSKGTLTHDVPCTLRNCYKYIHKAASLSSLKLPSTVTHRKPWKKHYCYRRTVLVNPDH